MRSPKNTLHHINEKPAGVVGRRINRSDARPVNTRPAGLRRLDAGGMRTVTGPDGVESTVPNWVADLVEAAEVALDASTPDNTELVDVDFEGHTANAPQWVAGMVRQAQAQAAIAESMDSARRTREFLRRQDTAAAPIRPSRSTRPRSPS